LTNKLVNMARAFRKRQTDAENCYGDILLSGQAYGPSGTLMKCSAQRAAGKRFPFTGRFLCRLASPFRCQSGFTLLEMMAVIVIMALVSAMALATFSSTGSEIEGQASALATVIRTLDDVAAARRETLELKFDFKEHTVQWTGPDGDKKIREFDMLTGVEALSLGLVHEGELTVMFDPSYTTESMLVHLESDDERMSVKYNPLGRRTKLIGPTRKDE